MVELLLHPTTAVSVQRLLSSPSHAILLSGPPGSGKTALSKYIVDHWQVPSQYQYVIQPVVGKQISIESIRELEHFLLLRVPGSASVNRVVVIEHADSMTREAQNALLKNLEEPPTGTVMVLTVDSDEGLLPTVRSRAQQISVITPSRAMIFEFFGAQGIALPTITQAFNVSGGLPGLMQSIFDDDASHPLLAAIIVARRLLQASMYERLLEVDGLTKQAPLTVNTLFILRQMAEVSLAAAKGAAAERWEQVMRASYAAGQELYEKGQPRLVLVKLMLNLG
jgi:hypothetical protein